LLTWGYAPPTGVYDVLIIATDSAGLSYSQVFQITITSY